MLFSLDNGDKNFLFRKKIIFLIFGINIASRAMVALEA
jgi:hypothetical protein